MERIEEFKELRKTLIEYGYEEKEATESALRAVFGTSVSNFY